MEKKNNAKKLSRKSIVQLSIMLGQMSHAMPSIYEGTKMRIVDAGVFDTWQEELKKILNSEI